MDHPQGVQQITENVGDTEEPEPSSAYITQRTHHTDTRVVS